MIYKKIVFLVTLLAFATSFSQSTDLKPLLKTDYTIKKNVDTLHVKYPLHANVTRDKTIKSKDTTALSFVKDFDLFKNNYFLRHYKSLIFKQDSSAIIYQWKEPIVVYFDHNIPQEITKNISQFILSIPEIDNLNITISKDINKANYYIKIANQEVSALTNKQKAEAPKDLIKTYPFSKIIYDWNGDYNYKMYSGVLQISPSYINDPQLLDDLKKVFFISLIQSKGYRVYDNTSILSSSNSNFSTLGAMDIVLLKYHYKNLYKFKVDYTVFSALENYYKQLAND